EPAEVVRSGSRLADELVDLLEQANCAPGPLAQHVAVRKQRGGRNIGRRVERQCQHPEKACSSRDFSFASSSISLCPTSRCRHRGRTRGSGSSSPAASGHSTNATVPSKYGSRSPHSAAETELKRYRSRWATGTRPRYR